MIYCSDVIIEGFFFLYFFMCLRDSQRKARRSTVYMVLCGAAAVVETKSAD